MTRNLWYDLKGTMQFHMVNYGFQVKEILPDIQDATGKYHTQVLVEEGSEAEREAIRLGGTRLNK